jgi:putative methyltransferase (TIGR04325 family)
MVPDEDVVWASKGWSDRSVVARQAEKWDPFVRSLKSPLPLGRSHEAAPDAPTGVSSHNTIMTFAYLVGRVIAEKGGCPVSILDWGGGLGHYYQYMRVLFPESSIDYWVKDLEELCIAGRERNHGANFVWDDRRALAREYDLVFASSSLHYTRRVYELVDDLCGVGNRYFMVTRTPFVERSDDFVVVQRPHRYGYLTEYAGWFLNKSRFVSFVEARGFVLDREFLLDERPFVGNAPEQCRYCGLLFRRVST